MKTKFRFSKAPKNKDNRDKQIFIIGFIIAALVLWSVIMFFDSRQTALSPAPFSLFDDRAVCGNGFVEPGENCGTCFLDARCLSSEVCQSGVCLQKRASLLSFIIPLIFLSLISIFWLSYKLVRRKKIVEKDKAYRVTNLVDYINKSFKSGHREPEIRINVLRAGWNQHDVDKAFSLSRRS